jgi:hydrogenase expression/formation protein HypC
MCLGIPGEIVEILPTPDLAMVDVSGVRRAINIGLLAEEELNPGDWILIHVGFALSKIDEKEAQSALEFLEGIGQAYADELEAYAESRIIEHDVYIPRPDEAKDLLAEPLTPVTE